MLDCSPPPSPPAPPHSLEKAVLLGSTGHPLDFEPSFFDCVLLLLGRPSFVQTAPSEAAHCTYLFRRQIELVILGGGC